MKGAVGELFADSFTFGPVSLCYLSVSPHSIKRSFGIFFSLRLINDLKYFCVCVCVIEHPTKVPFN